MILNVYVSCLLNQEAGGRTVSNPARRDARSRFAFYLP